MSGDFSERNIRRETREQYGPSFPAETFRQRADDIRRELILKYGVSPELRGQMEPRNMWREMAKMILENVDNSPETVGMDAGTSSGFMLEMLLEEGYKGRLVGADIETSHFSALNEWLYRKFPDAMVDLGVSNAESLRRIRMLDGSKHSIPADVNDFTIVANVMHHTSRPDAVFEAVHRATKPDGIAVYAGRNINHLANIYEMAKPLANKFGSSIPSSFYYKHHFDLIRSELETSPEYEVLHVSTQGEMINKDGSIENEGDLIWVPDNSEGRSDYKNTIYTLLPMMKKHSDNRQLQREEVEDFLEGEIMTYFKDLADFYGGDFPEGLSQGFIVARVIK